MKSNYEIDIYKTLEYTNSYIDGCTCIYCKNFRTAFAIHNANKRLNDLGLSVDSAVEIMDFPREDGTSMYYAYFSLYGNMTSEEEIIYDSDDVVMTIYPMGSNKLLYGNMGDNPTPLVLELEVELPWVLNERREDI